MPPIILNLIGGVVADRFDRRRLIIATQSITAGLMVLLATLTASGVVAVWHVLAIAAVTGAVNAFNTPARMALFPHLIERPALMSAVALNSSIWQGTRIVAPAIAGVLVAVFDTATAFYVAAAGNLIMAVVVVFLPAPAAQGPRSANAMQDLTEGVRFIARNSVFSFLIGMTFFNSFFGMAYVMLMPVFAVDVFGVGAGGQGLMMSVGGAGSLLVTLYLGTRKSVRGKGLILIGGAVMSGLTLAAFGLTADVVGSYSLAVALLFFVGAFTSTYMISIMSSLQMLVPDRMRGRVMGFYGMTWNIMPLGGMQAGALAGYVGAPIAVMIGGLVVTAFAAGPALLNRQVRSLGSFLNRAERREVAQPAS